MFSSYPRSIGKHLWFLHKVYLVNRNDSVDNIGVRIIFDQKGSVINVPCYKFKGKSFLIEKTSSRVN